MSRPQRNRRLSRRVWSPEHDLRQIRPVKRLFTPEIKRMLKDWLIRRRENPYPSRDEKKCLALETGLTYTQICNWFANWRRKLKNSENEQMKNSWGMLIKNYNTNARGNVEQFSISSEDSIWEEEFEDELSTEEEEQQEHFKDNNYKILSRKKPMLCKKIQNLKRKNLSSQRFFAKNSNYYNESIKMEHSNYFLDNNIGITAQCFQISSTTADAMQTKRDLSTNSLTSNAGQENKTKYKQKMMEKYLRDTYAQDQKSTEKHIFETDATSRSTGATELSKKWLESAAKFTPNKNNYYVEWINRTKQPKHGRSAVSSGINNSGSQSSVDSIYASFHHKDELDAAEALANLAFNCRQRMLDTRSSLSTAIPSSLNGISS